MSTTNEYSEPPPFEALYLENRPRITIESTESSSNFNANDLNALLERELDAEFTLAKVREDLLVLVAKLEKRSQKNAKKRCKKDNKKCCGILLPW